MIRRIYDSGGGHHNIVAEETPGVTTTLERDLVTGMTAGDFRLHKAAAT